MDIPQRLAEFFHRLQAAPAAASAEEALALVCRLIEEVENEFCPLPREQQPPSAQLLEAQQGSPAPPHFTQVPGDVGLEQAVPSARHRAGLWLQGQQAAPRVAPQPAQAPPAQVP